MIDWSQISDDPNSREAKQKMLSRLLDSQTVHFDDNIDSFLHKIVSGKRVLDVGFAGHTEEHMNSGAFRHAKIAKAASYCLGIDILAPLVEQMSKAGYNVRTIDATSDIDLGERFDVVVNGDVIEHVENPVALIRFSARHLAPGGRIYAITPNAFSQKFFRKLHRNRTIVTNLDHVFWVTPVTAAEIARRSGCELTAVHFVKRYSWLKRWIKKIQWRFSAVEYSYPDYIFEFKKQGAS